MRDALMREYQFFTGDRRFEETIGNISSIPADALGWCGEQLESLKPTEKNYNPEAKDYSPLVPIIGAVNLNEAAQFFEGLGENPFVQGAEVAFTQVWQLVKQAASKVKNASIEHLPDAFKGLVEKISTVINTIKNFLSEVKDELVELAKKGIEVLKIANAFYCGINNGLVGLLQCILYILQALFQPTMALSYEQYKNRRDLLEKAEDVLDWVLANGPVFLKGVKDLFSSSGGISQSDFEGIFDKLKGYWDNASRYTVAFYTGVIAFEFIINILLLIFTAGEGNIIKGTTYIQKVSSLLWVLTRETFSALTFGITDLLLGLGKLIFRFAKACAKGFKGFIKFIEELLQGAKNGAKAEDLAMTAEEIEEVVLKGKKAQSIFNILASVRTGFKKLGIEIVAKADGYLLKWREKPIFKGDFKEVNSFWNKIVKPRLGAGTGGAFKYLSEISSSKIFCQEQPMSCAAACIRQLAKDNGIDVPESLVREFAKTDWDTGTQLDNIKGAMTDIFKDMEVQVGTPYIGITDMKQTAEVISQVTKKPWIATIRPPGGTRHTIIVDKIEDGIVYIRDPWDKVKGFGQKNGVEATMTIDDFEYFWKQCRYHHARVIIKQ
ncbi:cysteine peptidase family C39 domain-containing protein [uncultured Chryseobacterium sp.]|uniref:cysteine peptidase family C39 domain-containing protein n=1 Tax=uncultured Chryseobacterium sp. TaxID=259322 RepID=UPI0025ED2F35|nr:cysteine peptidase family C39 domain-containing protein [uncultured Chryseobacterium sp.]